MELESIPSLTPIPNIVLSGISSNSAKDPTTLSSCREDKTETLNKILNEAFVDKPTVSGLIKQLTEPSQGPYSSGIAPKEFFDLICQLPQQNRLCKTRNHLQVLLWRDMKANKVARVGAGLYTVPEYASTVLQNQQHAQSAFEVNASSQATLNFNDSTSKANGKISSIETDSKLGSITGKTLLNGIFIKNDPAPPKLIADHVDFAPLDLSVLPLNKKCVPTATATTTTQKRKRSSSVLLNLARNKKLKLQTVANVRCTGGQSSNSILATMNGNSSVANHCDDKPTEPDASLSINGDSYHNHTSSDSETPIAAFVKRSHPNNMPCQLISKDACRKNGNAASIEACQNGSKTTRKKPKHVPVCYFCQYSSLHNMADRPEKLLRCSNCEFSAHPSCMGFPTDLPDRCQMMGWLCSDCKRCSVCLTVKNSMESLLVCDHCDRAFHLNCIQKVQFEVAEKLNEPWTCAECAKSITLESTSAKRNSSVGNEKETTKHEKQRDCLIQSTVDSISNGSGEEKSVFDKKVHNVMPWFNDKPFMENVAEHAITWTVDEVFGFVSKLGFPDQAAAFRREEIDGQALLLLKRNDVLSMLSLKLGPALKIYRRLSILQSLVFGVSDCSDNEK